MEASRTIEIRTARPSDGAAFAAIYGPFVAATAVTFEEVVPAADDMGARVAATLATLPWYAAVCDGAPVGYAYASRHRDRAAYRWAVDVSAYVDERMRGRGVGRALYGRLLATLADLGYHRAYAGIALPNEASIGLHRAAGFELVGVYRRVGFKAGAWHDVAWWSLDLCADGDPPREPRPFAGEAG